MSKKKRVPKHVHVDKYAKPRLGKKQQLKAAGNYHPQGEPSIAKRVVNDLAPGMMIPRPHYGVESFTYVTPGQKERLGIPPENLAYSGGNSDSPVIAYVDILGRIGIYQNGRDNSFVRKVLPNRPVSYQLFELLDRSVNMAHRPWKPELEGYWVLETNGEVPRSVDKAQSGISPLRISHFGVDASLDTKFYVPLVGDSVVLTNPFGDIMDRLSLSGVFLPYEPKVVSKLIESRPHLSNGTRYQV